MENKNISPHLEFLGKIVNTADLFFIALHVGWWAISAVAHIAGNYR